jgi:hypothetical protein
MALLRKRLSRDGVEFLMILGLKPLTIGAWAAPIEQNGHDRDVGRP